MHWTPTGSVPMDHDDETYTKIVTIFSIPFYPFTIFFVYHFVHTLLFIPFCPIPFCPHTILSNTILSNTILSAYHFVQYHFVRIPFCPYHFVLYHCVQSPPNRGAQSKQDRTSDYKRAVANR